MTFKVSLPDGEAILHIEAQTDDSRDKPMPLRMLAYASFLGLQYELPVYSTVLYFRPPAGRDDTGYYEYGNETRGGLRFKYTVLRLYELPAERFLDPASVGLLPFAALMKPPTGMTTKAWVQECVENIQAAAVDKPTRSTLLFALSLFGSLVHNPQLFEEMISEEMMQESPFYELIMQRGIERGIEQGMERGMERGARETTLENTLTVLRARFPNANINTVQPHLEAIADLNRLKQLNLEASLVPDFETFQRQLEV